MSDIRYGGHLGQDRGLVGLPGHDQRAARGEKSSVAVKRGESLRLRFGILIHATAPAEDLDLAAEYEHFRRTVAPRVEDAPARLRAVLAACERD